MTIVSAIVTFRTLCFADVSVSVDFPGASLPKWMGTRILGKPRRWQSGPGRGPNSKSTIVVNANTVARQPFELEFGIERAIGYASEAFAAWT